eukprot:4760501-Alexandrium_andersonii.AAC.1
MGPAPDPAGHMFQTNFGPSAVDRGQQGQGPVVQGLDAVVGSVGHKRAENSACLLYTSPSPRD